MDVKTNLTNVTQLIDAELHQKYLRNQSVSNTAYYSIIIAYIVFIIFGIIGNLFVIIAIIGNKSKYVFIGIIKEIKFYY